MIGVNDKRKGRKPALPSFFVLERKKELVSALCLGDCSVIGESLCVWVSDVIMWRKCLSSLWFFLFVGRYVWEGIAEIRSKRIFLPLM